MTPKACNTPKTYGIGNAPALNDTQTPCSVAAMPRMASKPVASCQLASASAAPAGASALATQPVFAPDPQSRFWSAVQAGDTACVQGCLDSGTVDLAMVYPADGIDALFMAAHAGHVETAKLLVQAASDTQGAHSLPGYPAQQLELATRKANPYLIACLLQAGADIPDTNGDRLLARLASDPNALPMATALLESMPAAGDATAFDINAVNAYGRSALARAIESGNVPMARLLLKHGADPALGKAFNSDAITAALRSGNVPLLRLLLAHGADLPDAQGRQSLARAIRQGNLAWVKHLIDAGADLNAQDRDSNSALTLAVMSGNSEAAKMLLQAGARLPLAADLQAALMTRLASFRDAGLVKLSGKAKEWADKQAAMFEAAHRGDLETMRELIAMSSCDFGMQEPDTGKSVLMIAAEGGHVALAQVLLQHGAAAGSNGGRSTVSDYATKQLDLALADRNLPAVRTLLQVGAGLPDANGDRPLMHAVRTADIGRATLLLQASRQANLAANVLIDAFNAKEETPLMRAVTDGNAQMVELLLDAGADVTLGMANDTPLRRALDAGNVAVLRLLLAAGADVPDPGGDYTLMQAIDWNKQDWVAVLLQAGASTKGGNYTPLEVAVARDQAAMVRMLLEAGIPAPTDPGARASLLDDARRNNNREILQLLLDAYKNSSH